MKVKRVLVVGSGLMGSGIAQVCAQAGIQVFLNDVSQEATRKAIENIDWSVGKSSGTLPWVWSCFCRYCSRMCSISRGKSSLRSRSGGTWTSTVFMR